MRVFFGALAQDLHVLKAFLLALIRLPVLSKKSYCMSFFVTSVFLVLVWSTENHALDGQFPPTNCCCITTKSIHFCSESLLLEKVGPLATT